MTSSLTFKVFGCAKNIAVVAIGKLQGDVVKPLHLLGYLLSLSGFGLFTAVRASQYQTAKPKLQ